MEPLYKRLNAEITQGEWYAEDGIFIRSGKEPVMNPGIANFLTYNENEANAAYTVLAVNNLHHLAEALEESVTEMQWVLGMLKKELPGNYSISNTIEKAKQALSKIS